MDKEEFMKLYQDIKEEKEINLDQFDFKTLHRINQLLLEEISMREKHIAITKRA